MSRHWHGRIRKAASSAGSVIARSLARARAPDPMTQRDTAGASRRGIERRVDAIMADFIQVGVVFMTVYGRDNAEAFFLTTDIDPAVYQRIIGGRFRRTGPGAGPASESVPA